MHMRPQAGDGDGAGLGLGVARRRCRIGKPVAGTGGRLWKFESVGGLGNSIVVSLVEPDETSDMPRFRSRAGLLQSTGQKTECIQSYR